MAKSKNSVICKSNTRKSFRKKPFSRKKKNQKRGSTKKRKYYAVGGNGNPKTHEVAARIMERYPFIHTCSSRNTEETYGEIVDMKTLLQKIPIPMTKSSVFVDVGSGYGRFAMYTSLSTPCQSVVGIELHEGRYAVAEKMRKEQAEEGVKNVQFKCGDVRTVGLPEQTTHLYMCSTCFSTKLHNDIVELAPNSVKCIITLKEFNVKGWVLRLKHSIKFSWSTTSVYYYVREKV